MDQFATVSQWASMRLSIGSALFITYFIFAMAYWYALIKQNQKPKIYMNISDLASKMYLFGLGALLSIGYSQGSIYMAVFTYITMLSALVLTFVNVLDLVSDKTRGILFLVYYVMVFAWYMGIMVDAYKTGNQLT